MKPTIEISMTDASFLAIIFDHWMDIAGIDPTEHMLELSKKLHGKVLC